MNFADNLKALRKEKGLTQEELSCATGISFHSINSYESGRRVPNAKTMLTLARYFQVSGDFLLGKTVNREDPFKWRDFENMETVKDAITGLFHRLLDSTRSSSDHNQKMVFDILVELRHLLISDNLTEAQMAAGPRPSADGPRYLHPLYRHLLGLCCLLRALPPHPQRGCLHRAIPKGVDNSGRRLQRQYPHPTDADGGDRHL